MVSKKCEECGTELLSARYRWYCPHCPRFIEKAPCGQKTKDECKQCDSNQEGCYCSWLEIPIDVEVKE